jgi:ABC-type phosphonate transport system ATPase subunit
MTDLNGAPVLEVAGLCKQFGQFVAVDDVSFGLRCGRSLAIVGASTNGSHRRCPGRCRAASGSGLRSPVPSRRSPPS